MSEITGGISTIKLRSINAMGITSNWDPEVAGAKLQHLIIKDEVGMVTVMDTGAKDFQNSMS